MFTINAEETEKHNGVVAGTLLVSDYVAKVLFDSGATHSFISSRFAKTLDMLPEKLSYALEVSIPLGEVVVDMGFLIRRSLLCLCVLPRRPFFVSNSVTPQVTELV